MCINAHSQHLEFSVLWFWLGGLLRLEDTLNKGLRRVASVEFSPAFQRRDQVVSLYRRVATIEFALISDVATRREYFVGLSRR
jgi:hypothetical protein